eukprot:3935723-Rhodomonas_salina.1
MPRKAPARVPSVRSESSGTRVRLKASPRKGTHSRSKSPHPGSRRGSKSSDIGGDLVARLEASEVQMQVFKDQLDHALENCKKAEDEKLDLHDRWRVVEASRQEALQQLADARQEAHTLYVSSIDQHSMLLLTKSINQERKKWLAQLLTTSSFDHRLRELAEKGQEGARRGDSLAARASELGEKLVEAEAGRARFPSSYSRAARCSVFTQLPGVPDSERRAKEMRRWQNMLRRST